MGRLKAHIRVIGILFIAIGGLFMPIGYGVSPKRDLSVFSNLADLGAFLTWGFVLMGIGLAVIIVFVLLPGRFED